MYEYKYNTSVLLNEPLVSTAKDVGFNLRMKAQVSAVWQHPTNKNEKILRITVS